MVKEEKVKNEEIDVDSYEDSMELKFKLTLSNAPLEFKIKYAKKIINDMSEKGKLGIMFSGGRDSSVLAYLAKEFNPILIYCDTGLSSQNAFNRVSLLAKELNLKIEILKPKIEAFEMWNTLGHFPIAPKRGHTYLKEKTGIKTSPVQCCYNLKEKPAKEYINNNNFGAILWGNRVADSNRRKLGIADHGIVHSPSSRWKCWSAEPIAFFKDEDIKDIVSNFDFRFVEKGEDGCQVCCTDLARKDNQLTRCFIQNREFFDKAILNGLGEQILKARGEENLNVADTLRYEPYKFLRIPSVSKRDVKK